MWDPVLEITQQVIGAYVSRITGKVYALEVPEIVSQVIEKLAMIRDTIDANGFMLNFSYAGMPYDEAERNLKCFVKHVLPEVKSWKSEGLHEPAALTMPAHAA